MISDDRGGFRLGPWKIEPLRGALSGPNGEVRHLEPKVMEVLVLLAERPNELVTRDSLLNAIWDRHVSADQLLTRAISEIRRALDDHRDQPAYIETVPKRGYRLIGDIRPIEDVKSPVVSDPIGSSPPRRSRVAAIAVLFSIVLALAYFSYGKFAVVPDQDRKHEQISTGAQTIGELDDFAMSVAVLPFVNISNDPENEYFSDGLSEEIRNLLAEIPQLKVIGRTSSFSFKGTHEDLRVIGQLLGAKAILEGTVRKSGDEVRVTAELIDSSDGSRIWAGSYHRTMTDIFELQDDVAAAIIDALKMHIGKYPSRGRPTEVAEAYALFLQARAALNVQDPRSAEVALQRAVEYDPKFAEAYELLAHVYWTDIPEIDPADEQRLCRDAAGKALAINPELDFARALYFEADPDTYSLFDVIETLVHAAKQQPSNPAILRTLSWNLLIAGYVSEALRVAERLVEVDPLSSIAHVRHAAALRASGLGQEAVSTLESAKLLSDGGMDWTLGEAYLEQNLDDAAIGYFETAVGESGGSDPSWVRSLITGARDPVLGQAHLDHQIPVILAATPSHEAELRRDDLNRLYLFLGHLDRYFDVIIEQGPGHSTWSNLPYYVLWGTLLNDRGFTAHPKYLEVAKSMGFIDLWEKRGPPDFCEKNQTQWVCT